VVSHHIRSIKNAQTRQYQSSNKKLEMKEYFNRIMRDLNRKQVPLCREHHVQVTNGTLPQTLGELTLEKIYQYKANKEKYGN